MPNGESTPDKNESRRTEQTAVAELESIRKGELLLIAVQIVSVVVTLLVAWIYYGQLRQMRIATEASTRAANLAADALELNSSQFDRNVRQLIYQTASQAESAKASSQATAMARRSFDATVQNFQRDQRAWLGVCGFNIAQFEAGKPIRLDVKVCNSGKTPANKVEEALEYKVWSQQIDGPNEADVNGLVFTPTNGVPPTGSYVMHAGQWGNLLGTPLQSSGQDVLDQMFPSIQNGTAFLYFFGECVIKTFSTLSTKHKCACSSSILRRRIWRIAGTTTR